MERYKRTWKDFLLGGSSKELSDKINPLIKKDIQKAFYTPPESCHTEMMEGAETMTLSSQMVYEKVRHIILNPQIWIPLDEPTSNVN